MQTPTILAIAEKELTLAFAGLSADWNPRVRIHRVSSGRQVALESVNAQRIGSLWQLQWTPPDTRGPAHYIIRFHGKPDRSVRIESRSSSWIESTRMTLAQSNWEASGLSPEERQALAHVGILTKATKSATASLEFRPTYAGASRRRIVWDTDNPHLLVWRPGPGEGDLEGRAPRWWISPAALSTDHGLIRFLDMFGEIPYNP